MDLSYLSGTSFQVTGLNPSTTYYWRVRGANSWGPGPWSQGRSFTTLGNVSVERLGDGVPLSYDLGGIYPNPFNPTTTIRFDLPESVPVRLSVFDALGREVDVLVTEQLQPGRYESLWDAGDRPSGVFLFRLVAGAFVRTGSMVLLK